MSLRLSLVALRNICTALGLTRLAMPKIGNHSLITLLLSSFLGCGRDRLCYNTVKSMIKDVFEISNIHVIIYI